jgi:hypothetical protein
MTIEAGEDLAMILPLPTARRAGEDAVRFINLKEYPSFFRDMRKGFPEPATRAFKGVDRALPPPAAAKLKVHEVGEFEASFVPTVRDFSRLDERFRLPDGTWEKLPLYMDYGFAVFKLKEGAKTVHPMAFEFPRRDPRTLFFPTVHIHDGEAHSKADFDHTLYCQRLDEETNTRSFYNWRESPQPAGMFMDVKNAQGLILADHHAYKLVIRGERKNEDTRMALA